MKCEECESTEKVATCADSISRCMTCRVAYNEKSHTDPIIEIVVSIIFFILQSLGVLSLIGFVGSIIWLGITLEDIMKTAYEYGLGDTVGEPIKKFFERIWCGRDGHC